MKMRGLALCFAVACVLGACTATPPQPPDEAPQADDSAATTTEALGSIPIATAQACSGDVTCPAQFNNCVPIGDFDCGEEFCRVPGIQCNAELSTFTRVEHVFQCFDAGGNSCVSLVQGRRLVHCGC
jgi:hypothetical protein